MKTVTITHVYHYIREEDSEEKEPVGGKTSQGFVGSYECLNDGNWGRGSEGHLKGTRRSRLSGDKNTKVPTEC